ncbi:Acetyltransferase [Candidatus Terasakiella magnetica]|nr:Acetyltransferase [Candidatus Terasakiella magnetica]
MSDGAIELVPAAQVHAELLAGMHAICFAAPWNARAMLDLLGMPGTQGAIAVAGGSLKPNLTPPGPAGLVLWRQAADEAEILTLAVLPPWRRQKLGGRLLRFAMDCVQAGGAGIMFLEAAADNTAALALYEGHGFNRVGLRKGYYGCVDGVTMSCSLVTDETGL